MILLNDNFEHLPQSYLFSTVARRVREFKEANPQEEVIRMDIGDVTRPMLPAVLEAMHRAVDDLGDSATFHGYGPEQGYEFLRTAIVLGDYIPRGVEIAADEVFVSDGAKSDLGNLGDLYSRGAQVAVADPSYPVYLDANIIDGRTNIELLPCTAETGFAPALPAKHADIIILCYPNNPTGVVLNRTQLKAWVDYARQEGSLLIYDSAYEAFITDSDIPRSIYEIEGAKEVAIEVRSFSKTAGFTGVRCGYTVVPKALKGRYSDGTEADLNALWNRRQCTKFNGASYVSQRGAQAIYSTDGQLQAREAINVYLNNARTLRSALLKGGLKVYGGEHSPYVWVEAPGKEDSWKFFDHLLNDCHVTCTPGSGFGKCGEGYVRLTGFNTPENTAKAVERILKTL